MTDTPRSLAVSVIGASGRMGSRVCAAVGAAADLRLVGTYDLDDDLGDLGGADVVVEFSVPDASAGNVAHCVSQGVHCVIGTTGWDESRLAAVEEQIAAAPPSRSGTGVGVLVAPNFALGAILMMGFATQAARFYESVEVIELHHPDKVDAPSGTAARTAAPAGRRPRDRRRRTRTGRDAVRRARVPRRPGRRDPGPLGAAPGPGRPSGDPVRQPGGAADHPARLLRPRLVHARRPRGRRAGSATTPA